MFVILLVKIRCKKAIWNQNTGLRDNAALCLLSRPWFSNPAQCWRKAYLLLAYIQHSHCSFWFSGRTHTGTPLQGNVIWIRGAPLQCQCNKTRGELYKICTKGKYWHDLLIDNGNVWAPCKKDKDNIITAIEKSLSNFIFFKFNTPDSMVAMRNERDL